MRCTLHCSLRIRIHIRLQWTVIRQMHISRSSYVQFHLSCSSQMPAKRKASAKAPVSRAKVAKKEVDKAPDTASPAPAPDSGKRSAWSAAGPFWSVFLPKHLGTNPFCLRHHLHAFASGWFSVSTRVFPSPISARSQFPTQHAPQEGREGRPLSGPGRGGGPQARHYRGVQGVRLLQGALRQAREGPHRRPPRHRGDRQRGEASQGLL